MGPLAGIKVIEAAGPTSGASTCLTAAPRFSRTPAELPDPPVAPGQNTDEVLASLDLSAKEIQALKASGAVA